jgi:hypothetical protein
MGENRWGIGGKIDPTRDGRIPSSRYGCARGLQIFQGFSGDLKVFSGSNDSQCLRPINIFSGILEPIGHNGLDMRKCFSFSNWANVQGHVSHDPVAKDVHCANGLVPEQHIAATHGHYLQAGLQLEKEMFHDDNIAVT